MSPAMKVLREGEQMSATLTLLQWRRSESDRRERSGGARPHEKA